MLLTIYILSIIGAYLETRKDIKKGRTDPTLLCVFMVFCPLLNTGGAVIYVMSQVGKLFSRVSSPTAIKKSFFVD
ncbi:hypothetical protein ABE073_04685 [Lederbergia citrisecunda]|uniref:hypothetical protein n=1 Tax=Lederbergia citrisecunda TaxID=2833583 RepID=UPI003D2978F3